MGYPVNVFYLRQKLLKNIIHALRNNENIKVLWTFPLHNLKCISFEARTSSSTTQNILRVNRSEDMSRFNFDFIWKSKSCGHLHHQILYPNSNVMGYRCNELKLFSKRSSSVWIFSVRGLSELGELKAFTVYYEISLERNMPDWGLSVLPRNFFRFFFFIIF